MVTLKQVCDVIQLLLQWQFLGGRGAMAPDPALLVVKKGPRVEEKIEKKSQTLSNKGPADDFGPGPSDP